MKKFILAAIAVASLVSSVFPQRAVKPCAIDGYIKDADPNGLNVRATPGKDGRLMTRLVRGESEISVEINGTAGNGWVRITNAEHGEKGEIFKETGWVFASLLATGTKGYPNYDGPVSLYASASKNSRRVKTLKGEDEVVLIDCAGGWAKVRHGGTIGWLAPDNQCGSPFTTCN